MLMLLLLLLFPYIYILLVGWLGVVSLSFCCLFLLLLAGSSEEYNMFVRSLKQHNSKMLDTENGRQKKTRERERVRARAKGMRTIEDMHNSCFQFSFVFFYLKKTTTTNYFPVTN